MVLDIFDETGGGRKEKRDRATVGVRCEDKEQEAREKEKERRKKGREVRGKGRLS
jgi:hypothetical protein